jgi:antitoxin component of MazEF toxin-antitoxin module
MKETQAKKPFRLKLKRRATRRTLGLMLKKITAGNLHSEVDWGNPVGKEAK